MGIYTNYPHSIYNDGAGGGGGDVGAPYLKNIMPTTGVKVVDENGYIGGNFLGVYYPNTNYYNNFAIVVPGADFSGEGLGTVTFVDNTATIGGRVYRTVTIGGVTWLAENLDYKFSGCGIGGSVTIGAPNAWYYNNNESIWGKDGRNCGLLYNWYAIQLLNNNRADLMPGWHVPTYDEWEYLVNEIGGLDVAGTRLKAANVSWAINWGGTDDFGFGVLPSGDYNGSSETFEDAVYNAGIWSITDDSVSLAYRRGFDNEARSGIALKDKRNGYAVRLVKDSS